MSTNEEVRNIIEYEFFRKDGLQDQLSKNFGEKINSEIGKFTRRQFLTIAGIALATTAAWFALYYQVQGNSEKLESTINEDQAALLILRLDQFERTQHDTKMIVEKLDERLRQSGI